MDPPSVPASVYQGYRSDQAPGRRTEVTAGVFYRSQVHQDYPESPGGSPISDGALRSTQGYISVPLSATGCRFFHASVLFYGQEDRRRGNLQVRTPLGHIHEIRVEQIVNMTTEPPFLSSLSPISLSHIS